MFVPVLLLTGTAQYLFTPLAMAVVFAMMASYLLSRTLVPTMVHHLLRSEVAVYHAGGHGGQGILWSLHRGVNGLFERLRYRYMGLLNLSLDRRAPVLIGFMAVSLGSLLLAPMVGRDFFPDVDAGTIAPARAHAAGNAHRGDRAAVRRRRTGDSRHAACRRGRHDSRQHRDSECVGQPRAGRCPEHRRHRRRDPDFAQSRASWAGTASTKFSFASGSRKSSRTWCSSSSRRTSRTRF